MHRTLPIIIGFTVLIFLASGCQTRTTGFRPQAEERSVSAEPDRVLRAAAAALEEMEFRSVRRRGNRIEGLTAIVRDPAFRENTQTRAIVEVQIDQPAGTQVRVWFSRLVQADEDFIGTRTHEVHLRDPGLFNRFFDALEQRL